MLEAQGKYNNLSDQLRKDIEAKAAEAPRYVKYRFAIANKNPDGERKTGGEYLYPLIYTLTPVTFNITDPYDKKLKRIAIVNTLKEMGAMEDSFHKLKIKEGWQGLYTLDMEKSLDRDLFAYIYLHPKLEGGKFRDEQMPAIIKYVDELSDAKYSLRMRNQKIESLMVANSFKTQQVRDFASAMGWNDSEDPHILKDKIVTLAEEDPEFFKNFIDDKNIEVRAVIQRAIDSKVWDWVPVESKFVWTSNKQVIAVLERAEGANMLDRMCDWVMTSKNGQEIFAQTKKILQGLKTPA